MGRQVSSFSLISTGEADLNNDRIPWLDMSETGRDRSRLIAPSSLVNIIAISLESGFASTSFVSGVSGDLQNQIDDINSNTGDFLTQQSANNLYVNITGNELISGVKSFDSRPTVSGSGVLLIGELSEFDTGILTNFVNKSDTGNLLDQSQAAFLYYPKSNPSGYITGVDLSNYSTISFVTGISGNLQSQISSINSNTGDFIKSGQTGQFYASSNPNNYISNEDADSKFVNITGNENISGTKTFFSRPTVNGTGVLLSGEVTSDTSFEFLPNVRGFTGGTLSNLDGIPTSTYQISGKVVCFVYSGVPFQLRHYYLVNNSGSIYTGDGNGIIIPNDNPNKAWISL